MHDNSQMRYFAGDNDIPCPLSVGQSLQVDFNNELQTKQFTQLRISSISDRKAAFTARFARPAKADMDVYALRDAGTVILLDFTTDDGTNYSRLKIRGQIETITDTDIEGDFGYEISGPCIASTGGGNEFSVEFGVSLLRLIGDLPDQPQAPTAVAEPAGRVRLARDLQRPVGSAAGWLLAQLGDRRRQRHRNRRHDRVRHPGDHHRRGGRCHHGGLVEPVDHDHLMQHRPAG